MKKMTRRVTVTLLAVALALNVAVSSCFVLVGGIIFIIMYFVTKDVHPGSPGNVGNDPAEPSQDNAPPVPCGHRLDAFPNIDTLFIGPTDMIERLYAVLADMDAKQPEYPQKIPYVVPKLIRDASVKTDIDNDGKPDDGNVPSLLQETKLLDYHADTRATDQCLTLYELKCSSPNDLACYISRNRPGKVRVVDGALLERLRDSYTNPDLGANQPPDPAYGVPMLGDAYIYGILTHATLHAFGAHNGATPGMDKDGNFIWGGQLAAGLSLKTALWDSIFFGIPGGATNFPYGIYNTPVAETRFVEAYLLDLITVLPRVQDIASLAPYIDYVHPHFKDNIIFDPTAGGKIDVGDILSRYFGALANYTY